MPRVIPPPRRPTAAEVEERQIEAAKRAYVDGHIPLERLEEILTRRLRGEDVAGMLPAPPLADPSKRSTR